MFRTRPRDEWASLLGDKDCCVSAIYTPEEALDVESDTGSPGLGADTQAVLRAAGMSEEELAALSAARAM